MGWDGMGWDGMDGRMDDSEQPGYKSTAGAVLIKCCSGCFESCLDCLI